MNTITIAIIATCAIGLLAAILLTVASKLMYVKVDPLVGKIRQVLPGAGCGVCGFPGCDGYAEALAKGAAQVNLCRPGGAELVAQLAGMLGVDEAEGPARKIAVVRCLGADDVKSDKMEYEGINTCFAAEQLYGGKNACSFGCLGYGDCTGVCSQNAICISGGIAHIDPRKCMGCEQCLAQCPRNVITVQDAPINAIVLCCNTEKGAAVRKKCSKGCIACTKCVRECPEKAITISDSLAAIDYDKCTGCGRCIEVCMTKCIVAYLPETVSD